MLKSLAGDGDAGGGDVSVGMSSLVPLGAIAYSTPRGHPCALCLLTFGHNQPRSEVSFGASQCPVLVQYHKPKGSFL